MPAFLERPIRMYDDVSKKCQPSVEYLSNLEASISRLTDFLLCPKSRVTYDRHLGKPIAEIVIGDNVALNYGATSDA
jgi:hypothetical protein